MTIHLHHSWKNLTLVGEPRIAISACGARGLTRKQWVKYVDDCNCSKCIAIAKRKPVEEEAPPSPEPKTNGRAPIIRPGSRKATIYRCWKDKGLDAATELAVSLGLKASTVKSWISDWTREV